MGNRKSIFKIILAVVLILTTVLMAGCKTDDVTKRTENEEKLLKAMIEYPGEGLYDPEMTVIGLGAPEPTEEELAESQQRAAEEKDAWHNAVGDCFAEGMFDTFYGEWFRNEYLGLAWANGLSTAITEISITDDASQDPDNIEHALITVTATDKEGAANSFVMDWQVIFDRDDPGLIQKINLIDDGGFWDAYTGLS